MTESREAQIERLMAEGLNEYAMGDDAKAIECWQRVLELDPQHAEAQDYLRTATDAPEEPAEEPAPTPAADEAPSAPTAMLDAALELLRGGECHDALEMLEALERENPSDLGIQGHIELARFALLPRLRERLCDGIAVPRLRVSRDEILKFNLPANAGFVVSTVDGVTSVNEMIELSGMDPFEGLRTCCRLLDAGIIEVHP